MAVFAALVKQLFNNLFLHAQKISEVRTFHCTNNFMFIFSNPFFFQAMVARGYSGDPTHHQTFFFSPLKIQAVDWLALSLLAIFSVASFCFSSGNFAKLL